MTDLCFSNTFTVVSLARELTKFTISIKTEGSRKCDAISAVHCWAEGHPIDPQHPNNMKRKSHQYWGIHTDPVQSNPVITLESNNKHFETRLTKFSHKVHPWLADKLVDRMHGAQGPLLQLGHLFSKRCTSRRKITLKHYKYTNEGTMW